MSGNKARLQAITAVNNYKPLTTQLNWRRLPLVSCLTPTFLAWK